MSVRKIISRLDDWFDCVVLLDLEPGAAATHRPLAQSLAGTLPLIQIDRPGDDPQPHKAMLRERALKRPLLLAAGRGGEALLEAWAQPYRVYLAGGAGSTASAQRCDLVVASSSVDLQALGLDRDWAGGRLVTADPGAVAAAICEGVRHGQAETKRLNIAVLYCDVFTHIETIYEHLNSFSLHSRHNYFYFPVSDAWHMAMFAGHTDPWPEAFDLDIYDVVIWHYVVPAYLADRISPHVADRLAAYDGLKVLFVQDEYDTTATTTRWVQQTGIDVMMTCVPPEGLQYVYPAEQHPGVEFFRTLTGYVPENRGLARFAIPMAERSLRLAYRGRALEYRYGALAREKYDIGIRMKALAAQHGISADIAVDEDSRIYGTDWYRFLGSARATLATESGANVFDFDGSLKPISRAAEDRGQSFEDFHAEHLAEIDGIVQMNQVSPKIFEAIRMRTALVCFEGGYSGVIQPDVHYIPLKKDYSNVRDVFAKLEDVAYLEAMTTRAFDDVIGSGRYSYAAFVAEMEEIIESRSVRPTRAEIISSPILRRRRGQSKFEPVVRISPFEHILNTGILRKDLQRRQFEEVMAGVREAEITPNRVHTTLPAENAAILRCYGPEAVVCYEFWSDAGASVEAVQGGARITTPSVAWHYAAGVNLDFSGIDFAHEHGWLKVTVQDVEGQFRISLYDADEDKLHEEKIVTGPGVHTVVLRIAVKSRSLLLFRTGQFESASAATFIGAEILSAPAYPGPVIDLARTLFDLPRGGFRWWP